MTSQHEDIKKEFVKGSKRMKDTEDRVDALEHAETRRKTILSVLAVAVSAVGLERLADWISTLSK